MTIRTIDMGTKTRKALDIENAFGDLGTSLAGNVGARVLAARLRGAEAQPVAGAGIIADVVQNAAFPAAEVEREKKRQLDSLAQTEKNGNAIASRVARAARLRRRPSLRTAARRACPALSRPYPRRPRGFPSGRWKPGSSALVFVGGVTMAEATALAQAALRVAGPVGRAGGT